MISYQNKIYAVAGALVAVCAALFIYGFGIMDGYNQAVASKVEAKNMEYQQLVQEQKSYEQNQRDLKTLAAKPLQPDNFFSQDVRLVKEIKTLESLAQTLQLEFDLEVSGTVSQGLPTPNTASGIVSIPYTMTVTGGFSDVVTFLDRVEHLDFVTHIGAVTVTSADKGRIKATMSPTFFIQK